MRVCGKGRGFSALWRALGVAAGLMVLGGCDLGSDSYVKKSETILRQSLRSDRATVRMLAMTAYRELERDIPDEELQVLLGDPFAPRRFLAVMCKAEQASRRGKQRRRDLSYFRVLYNKETDPSVRLAAVYGMALLGDMSHIEELAEALADRGGDAAARRNAAMLLGLLENKTAVPMLGAYLSDADAVVQMNAAEAMGRLGSTRGLEVLRRMATSQGSPRQISAILALGRVGLVPRDVMLLREAFSDDKPVSAMARLASYGARAMLGDYTQAARLGEMASGRPGRDPIDAQDKAMILQLLARSAYGPSWRSVVPSLDDGDPLIRASAAWAILAFDSAEGKKLRDTIEASTAADRGVQQLTEQEILRPGSSPESKPSGSSPGRKPSGMSPLLREPRAGPLGPIGPIRPQDTRVR